MAAMGEPELARDERFATNQARVANADELQEKIVAWVRTFTLEAIERVMVEYEIPAGAILDIEQITNHPQIRARGAVQMIRDREGNEVVTYRPVPRFGSRPMVMGEAADAIGRDQAAVLSELNVPK
jgi:crotonobetainyl-CoA:carnitine CoA-transferase CaiB-like acyl-CoA transferase